MSSLLRPSAARAILGLFLAVLQALPAYAGTIEFAQDGLNARSSLSFRGRRNVLATVPKGTTGEVLDRWELPSGNYGVKVKIKTLGDLGTSLKIDDEVWVYYHRDPNYRRVNLLDDDGKKVENADQGKWAVALSSFKIATATTPPSNAAPCETCQVSVASESVAPLSSAQVIDLAPIAAAAAEATSNAPVLDVGMEEVLTYIRADQKKSLSRSDLAKTDEKSNRLIARTLIEESARQGIPIELALAISQKESHFYHDASSPTSAARGLMQLMPAAIFDYYGFSAVEAARLSRVERQKYLDAANEPALNIRIGLTQFAKCLKRYDGNVRYALSAYNMGITGFDNYLRGKRSLTAETRKYAPAVLKNRANYLEYAKVSQTSLLAANP